MAATPWEEYEEEAVILRGIHLYRAWRQAHEELDGALQDISVQLSGGRAGAGRRGPRATLSQTSLRMPR
jgi:hypothetical protein